MPLNVKRRGKLTYYYEGDTPVLSNLAKEHCPENGLPARFTVHVVDFPDRAASYEFYGTALYQKAGRGE